MGLLTTDGLAKSPPNPAEEMAAVCALHAPWAAAGNRRASKVLAKTRAKANAPTGNLRRMSESGMRRSAVDPLPIRSQTSAQSSIPELNTKRAQSRLASSRRQRAKISPALDPQPAPFSPNSAIRLDHHQGHVVVLHSARLEAIYAVENALAHLLCAQARPLHFTSATPLPGW